MDVRSWVFFFKALGFLNQLCRLGLLCFDLSILSISVQYHLSWVSGKSNICLNHWTEQIKCKPTDENPSRWLFRLKELDKILTYRSNCHCLRNTSHSLARRTHFRRTFVVLFQLIVWPWSAQVYLNISHNCIYMYQELQRKLSNDRHNRMLKCIWRFRGRFRLLWFPCSLRYMKDKCKDLKLTSKKVRYSEGLTRRWVCIVWKFESQLKWLVIKCGQQCMNMWIPVGRILQVSSS